MPANLSNYTAVMIMSVFVQRIRECDKITDKYKITYEKNSALICHLVTVLEILMSTFSLSQNCFCFGMLNRTESRDLPQMISSRTKVYALDYVSMIPSFLALQNNISLILKHNCTSIFIFQIYWQLSTIRSSLRLIKPGPLGLMNYH